MIRERAARREEDGSRGQRECKPPQPLFPFHHHNPAVPPAPTNPPPSTMSTFIKFGNHTIAPAGTKPTPIPTSPTTTSMADATDALALARLLHSKVKDLEQAVVERKARRQEWHAAVERLDKNLVALRAQDSKEGEKLAKLVKRWNKTQPRDHAPRYKTQHHDYRRESEDEAPFVCPTTQAASAFNGTSERYRDTYTFSGPAWQGASNAGSYFSSPPHAHAFARDFLYTMSPEALDPDGFSTADTPTKHGHLRTAALSDIQNTPQDAGSSNSRKRKTVDMEADSADEGLHKKTRAGGMRSYGSGRSDSDGSAVHNFLPGDEAVTLA
ncbi:hypothetical protein C8R47DRAFT_579796 [Mycena vitilis]|nr:hypothetical protein C8R47DRAFT_579796 [Mycena vitilis]